MSQVHMSSEKHVLPLSSDCSLRGKAEKEHHDLRKSARKSRELTILRSTSFPTQYHFKIKRIKNSYVRMTSRKSLPLSSLLRREWCCTGTDPSLPSVLKDDTADGAGSPLCVTPPAGQVSNPTGAATASLPPTNSWAGSRIIELFALGSPLASPCLRVCSSVK